MKYIFFSLLIIILLPLSAIAETSTVLVGPIQAVGKTADDEFIILINPGDQSIDIGTWSIQYKSANGSTFYKKNFSKGAIIPATGTYVICGKDFADPCDMKHSSFSLSSAGGTVFLVSNQTLITSSESNTIVAQKTYEATTSEQISNTNIENPNSNNQTPEQIPNSNNQNPNPTPVTLARQSDIQQISINEFMAAPVEGDDEWIELYNGTNYSIELANWTIADGTGKNFITLDGLILPTQFKLIKLAASHLNNDGDLIILRDGNKNEIDSVAYGDWENNTNNAPSGDEGVAIARQGDGVDSNRNNYDFAATATATPGAANIIVAPAAKDERTMTETGAGKISKTETQWLSDMLSKQSDEISKLLKADNIIIINNLNIDTSTTDPIKTATVAAVKTTATKTISAPTTKTTTAATQINKMIQKSANTIEGMVIVPAGIVGTDICVVRESNRSVEVRLPKDIKESPVAGDIINTSGTWSTAKTLTLPRLLVKTGAPVTISDHDTPPEPLSIPMSKINDHIGEIIATSGTIVEKQPTRLRIAEGDDSLVIKTNFSAAKGEKLSATGLLIKNSTDNLLTTLAPDALSIVKEPIIGGSSLVKTALPYGIAVLPASILAGSVYIGKRMKKKKNADND